MKKLTAGILTVMLGIVSANSADAAVASKLYVDSKADAAAAAAQSAAESTAASALAGAKSELEGKIDAKVAQSDYDTKIGQLEQADTNISNLVGALPTDAGVNNVVAYIDKKTTGIATDTALDELSNKVTANTGAIETLNGTGEGSVAKQIADSITALDLANTYDAAGSATAAETAAKNYADSLAGNYATKAQGELADTAVQSVVAGSVNGTISVDGVDVAVTGLGSAAYTSADAYDPKGSANAVQQNLESFSGVVTTLTDDVQLLKGDANTAGSVAYAVQEAKSQAVSTARQETISKISELNLNELSRVPAECSDAKNYCVLTTNGSKYLWEVIERATGEAQPEGTDIPSVIDDSFGA